VRKLLNKQIRGKKVLGGGRIEGKGAPKRSGRGTPRTKILPLGKKRRKLRLIVSEVLAPDSEKGRAHRKQDPWSQRSWPRQLKKARMTSSTEKRKKGPLSEGNR